jgi:hypothetical protein
MPVPRVGQGTMRDGHVVAHQYVYVVPVHPDGMDGERLRSEHAEGVEPPDRGPDREGLIQLLQAVRQRNPPPHPGLGKRPRAVGDELLLRVRFRQVNRERQVLAVRERRDRTEERAAHRVRRVGGDPRSHPRALEPGQRAHSSHQASHALRQLVGMRTEDLVVHDPAPTRLSKCLQDGAGVPGVGDRGDSTCPARLEARPGCLPILRRAPLLLDPPDGPDPLGKVSWLRHVPETGELEVGVGVDQAGDDHRLIETFGWHAWRRGDRAVGADHRDPAILPDQDGAVPDRRPDNRKNPCGGQADRRHLSGRRRGGRPRAMGRSHVAPSQG